MAVIDQSPAPLALLGQRDRSTINGFLLLLALAEIYKHGLILLAFLSGFKQ